MATLNIALPDSLREFIEDQVARGAYASASEFVRDRVRRAKQEHELEARLLEALESEDLGEIGPEFFEELKAAARTAAGRQRN